MAGAAGPGMGWMSQTRSAFGSAGPPMPAPVLPAQPPAPAQPSAPAPPAEPAQVGAAGLEPAMGTLVETLKTMMAAMAATTAKAHAAPEPDHTPTRPTTLPTSDSYVVGILLAAGEPVPEYVPEGMRIDEWDGSEVAMRMVRDHPDLYGLLARTAERCARPQPPAPQEEGACWGPKTRVGDIIRGGWTPTSPQALAQASEFQRQEAGGALTGQVRLRDWHKFKMLQGGWQGSELAAGLEGLYVRMLTRIPAWFPGPADGDAVADALDPDTWTPDTQCVQALRALGCWRSWEGDNAASIAYRTAIAHLSGSGLTLGFWRAGDEAARGATLAYPILSMMLSGHAARVAAGPTREARGAGVAKPHTGGPEAERRAWSASPSSPADVWPSVEPRSRVVARPPAAGAAPAPAWSPFPPLPLGQPPLPLGQPALPLGQPAAGRLPSAKRNHQDQSWGACEFDDSKVGTGAGGAGDAGQSVEMPISLRGKHVAFVDLDNMAGALDEICDQFDVLFAYAGASYNGPLPRARALPFAGSLVKPPTIITRRGGTQRKDEADVYCMWDVVSYASQLPAAASVYFISADAIFNTMAAVIESKVQKRIKVVSAVAAAKLIKVARAPGERWV